jgi:hypothetical protein
MKWRADWSWKGPKHPVKPIVKAKRQKPKPVNALCTYEQAEELKIVRAATKHI